MKVGIVDFGLSNLYSVTQACSDLGVDIECTNSISKLSQTDALILPGVGAFGEAIRSLKEQNLDVFLKDWVNDGKRLLGICLGMQLLFSESQEFGNHEGLGIFAGKVQKFPKHTSNGDNVRIPAVGWSSLIPPAQSSDRWDRSILDSLSTTTTDAYFVHSFYCVPEKKEIILAESEYQGIRYCSAVSWENVSAVQFHPEKSGIDGQTMLKNWVKHSS